MAILPIGAMVEIRPVRPQYKWEAFKAMVVHNTSVWPADSGEGESGWYYVVDLNGQQHEASSIVVFPIESDLSISDKIRLLSLTGKGAKIDRRRKDIEDLAKLLEAGMLRTALQFSGSYGFHDAGSKRDRETLRAIEKMVIAFADGE